MGGWKIARLVLCGIGIVQGIIVPFLPQLLEVPQDPMLSSVIPLPWSLILIILPILFFPFAMLFVIGIQSANPLSNKVWTKSDWNSNFLNLGTRCISSISEVTSPSASE